MKNFILLILGLALVACTIPPSDAVIQTAIAKTQMAASGETLEPPDYYQLIADTANLPSGFEFAEAETQMPERYLWGVPVDHFAGYTIKNGEFPVGWIEVFAFRSDRQAYIAYSKFWDEREIAKPVVPPPIIGEMTSLYMPELVVNDDPSLALQVVIKQCNCVVDYFIWTEAGADEVFNSAKSLANAIPCP